MRRGHDEPTGCKPGPGRFVSGKSGRRVLATRAASLMLLVGLLVVGGQGSAGHQVGHYPSYYPDEIRIDAIDPAAAGTALREETLHAYLGAVPSFTGGVPEHVKSVTSLGSFVVLSFNDASARFTSAQARCAAARSIMAELREARSGGFVFHPYPITPYHADYLHHLDRIEVAVGSLAGAASTAAIRLGGKDQLARSIIQARWGLQADAGDFTLETVSIEDLVAAAGVQLDGWSGPPWIKEGWFHAYRLLVGGLDSAEREVADREYEPLIRGQTRSFAEHVDFERRLVVALVSPCRRLVVGYVPRQEYYDDRYPEGVENIGYDSLSGLNAPIFIRTVKLKDYPWNGKLHLGVRDRPTAAWNPIAGFTDAMGRLIWSAVSDPAMIPFPSNASWMPNRVQSEVSRVIGRSGGVRVPHDAVLPQPGSGALRRVGERVSASAKVTYDVLASPFEDGTDVTAADLLYPFSFAYRWGSDQGGNGSSLEPRLASVLASLERRLIGLKYVRTDKTTHAIAEGMNLDVRTPVLEVFLNAAPWDDRQVAALAPPWSTIPWHLLALMEEAVARGYAAFSQEEAVRQGVPWLDLVRDSALKAKLLELIATFERGGYRPAALEDLVTADEARARWRALRSFAEEHGHLLVTNGPYRLKQWTDRSAVLEAVREMAYPLGFGTFDRFVNPPRATVETVTREGRDITVSASAEMVLKAARTYRLVKEPLLRTTTRGVYGLLVVSRYLLIAPDGEVLTVDKMHWADDGRFHIQLPDGLAPGPYTVVLGIFLDGNAVQPSAKVMRFDVAATGAPQ